MTSSRVPGTRPGRPMAGKTDSASTWFFTAANISAAAPGHSCAKVLASASSLAIAWRSHLTLIGLPPLRYGFDFFITGEVARISLLDGLRDLANLPRFALKKIADGL